MAIQCLTADSQLLSHSFDTSAYRIDDTGVDASQLEDRFATMPEMPIVSVIPVYQQPNEEELHTSFEQAISDRVLIVNKQLSLKSGPLAYTRQMYSATEALQYSNAMAQSVSVQEKRQTKSHASLLENAWQRSIIFACTALLLLLTGFDLMGLLVLHAH